MSKITFIASQIKYILLHQDFVYTGIKRKKQFPGGQNKIGLGEEGGMDGGKLGKQKGLGKKHKQHSTPIQNRISIGTKLYKSK